MQDTIVAMFSAITTKYDQEVSDIILEKHYEKFKLLYKSLKKTSDVDLDSITYELGDESLIVRIVDLTEEDEDIIRDYINGKAEVEAEFTYKDNNLLIIMKIDEDDYYENRFN